MVGASPSGSSVVDSINNLDVALQARNKYVFVDGTCLKESYATSNVLYAQWDRCNVMVLTWIMNVVSQDVYMGLVYSENDDTVWKELNETYDKVDAKFSFKRDPLPKVKDAYNVISREESHKGVPDSFGGAESKQNATSFVAKTFNNNRRQFNKNNFTRGSASNVNRGANQHLTVSTDGMFTVVDISSINITVGHPNGTLATISHDGNLKLSNNKLDKMANRHEDTLKIQDQSVETTSGRVVTTSGLQRDTALNQVEPVDVSDLESLYSLDDEPSDSVLCTIAYSDFSSDDDSDTDSLESDSDFRVHMINPIPHVLPIQEDPPLPLAKINLLTDAYAKPIPVITFFDTGSSVSILNPMILPDHYWKPHHQNFIAANGEKFVIDKISVPIINPRSKKSLH
ncbi:hypothetical protein Tco_0820071 [Tanacetum coccineum]|uniref:Gag-pol polyprotein n=1 Tax=Tanacetum coccineum TaxID=301880 RepID=A0ABQ5ABE3_9ASTR